MTQSLHCFNVTSELHFAEDELFLGVRTDFVSNLRRQLTLGQARVSSQTLTPIGILMDYGHYHEEEVTNNLLIGAGMFERTDAGRRFDADAVAPVYVISEGKTPTRILVVTLRSAADGARSVGIGTMPLVALVPRPARAFTGH